MISDAYFTQQAIRGFTRQDGDIARLQESLSRGTNDPRVSTDPARALELSALRDMRSEMTTQTAIGRNAADRLAIGDAALAEASDLMREIYRIALQAGTDTLTPEAQGALRVQAETMRASLLAVANMPDPQGRPLFSGTAPGPAFVQSAQGVAYQGDLAAPHVQMGTHARLETGLTGARVFGTGDDSAFALLDDVIAALAEPVLSARDQVTAQFHARLDVIGAATTEITLFMQGPDGRADITLPTGTGETTAQVDAINALTAQTGIRAQAMADGIGIQLIASGTMTLSDQRGPDPQPAQRPVVQLTALGTDGQPLRDAVALRPAAMTRDNLIARASDKVDHMANMRAAIGAMGQAIDARLDRLADTGLRLDQAVSSLQDVNVAEAITKLQALLLNQQAAQQTFVRITSRSLFDYLG